MAKRQTQLKDNPYFLGWRDANEEEIVGALIAAGATVERITGRGLPDLLVGYKGENFLLEVKNPRTQGQLSKDQRKWHSTWEGQCAVVRSPDGALQILKRD